MITTRRLVALMAGVCLLEAAAGEIRLPPITGELSGDFKPLQAAGAPTLHWNLGVSGATDGTASRLVDAKIDGEGTRLEATANLATPTDGTWRISAGKLNLATWFPVVAEQVGEAMKELLAKGEIQISGDGKIRAGQPGGAVAVEVRADRIENPNGGWTLERVALKGEFAFEVAGLAVKSVAPFELTVGTIGTPRFGARNVMVRGLLNEDRTVALQEAHLEIAGGDVSLDLVVINLSPMAVEATVHIVKVGLQDLVALVPSSLSAANGRIDGTVRLGWNAADGFHVGAGELALNRSEPATVQLVPAPGFLSRSVPKRFDLLPGWTGPIGRQFAFDNPIYSALEEIELGREPLSVDSLNVKLTPEGDVEGHTATIRMQAHPTKAVSAVKTLKFDVNVAGSLDSILTLGMNQGLSVKAH